MRVRLLEGLWSVKSGKSHNPVAGFRYQCQQDAMTRSSEQYVGFA